MALTYLQSKQIAARYVSAWYDLAANEGREAEIAEALNQLAAWIKENDDLRRVIESRAIAEAVKTKALEEILTVAKAPALLIQMVKSLSENGRAEVLAHAAPIFSDLLRKHSGELKAEVVSANPLSDSQRKELQESLSKKLGKTVHLVTNEDSSLLGGLRLFIGSQMVDMSVSGKLKRLRSLMRAA